MLEEKHLWKSRKPLQKLTDAESGGLGLPKRSPTPKAPCRAVLLLLLSSSVCMDRAAWSYVPGPGAAVDALFHL